MIIIYINKITSDSLTVTAAKSLGDESKQEVTSCMGLESKLDLSKIPKEEELTLANLEADGMFQKTVSPSKLAALLAKSGLSKSIKRINILISDTPKPIEPYSALSVSFYNDPEPSGMSVAVFSKYLVEELVNKYGFNPLLTVTYSASLAYDYTIIQPPGLIEKNWKVYGIINAPKECADSPSYEKFLAYKEKKLLWEGSNIYDWLHKPERSFTATSTAVSNKSLDSRI